MKDNALQLVPDSSTVCLGVNETARRGGKRGEEGKRKDRGQKETERKGHRGEKVTALLAAIELSCFSTKKWTFLQQLSPEYTHSWSKLEP